MSHQKPGFPLKASVTAQPGGATLIHFTLPGGVEAAAPGPPMTADQIGPVNVMYYPDQMVLVLLPQHGGGIHRMEIPISELPPHGTPPAPERVQRGRPRDN